MGCASLGLGAALGSAAALVVATAASFWFFRARSAGI
jgi:hypothetical protein